MHRTFVKYVRHLSHSSRRQRKYSVGQSMVIYPVPVRVRLAEIAGSHGIVFYRTYYLSCARGSEFNE